MDTTLSREQREIRRMLAVRILQQGKGVRETAALLGVSPASVSGWKAKVEKGGPEALRSKKALGPKPRLSESQMRRLENILLRGPKKSGYQNDLWTCPRVAAVIERTFGVKYHPDHVWKLLHYKLGWSCQMPEHRAREQDEKAAQQWRDHDWPRIKKGPSQES